MALIGRTLVLFAMLIAFTGAAQEITFTATVDRNSIATGEHIKLTVALTNSQEQFTPPDLGGLVILQGPFESSSFNYVNGRMSSSVSRTWVITATQPGTYTIGAAKVRVGGGIIQTDPITIEVVKGNSRPTDPGAAQGQQRDPNLFVTIALSKNKAYVGEQVVASYVLYSRYPNIELSKYDLPALNGFWSEDIELQNDGWEDRPETVNGVQYRVAVLKKQLLFAQRAGRLRIEPAELTCVVNRSFFSRGTTIRIASNPAELIAMDLPPGAPADFSGAVGELDLSVEVDRTQLQANEAIEMNVRISGRANLKLLDAPSIAFPTDLEVYDPKVNDKINTTENGMSGSREFQYLVIPRHEGIYEIGPIGMSYFDTRTGQYRSLSKEPIRIEVSPGTGTPQASGTPRTGREVQVIDHDIRYIRTGDLDLRPHGSSFFGSVQWWAAMATPALGFLLFLAWHGRNEAERADEAGTRRKKADRIARKRLSEAEKALQQDRKEPFYAALSKALNGYLADKFSLGVADVNATTLKEKLAALPDGGSIADRYVDLIAACDMARFAPVEDRPRRDLYEQAVELIGNIERTSRS